MSVFENLNLGVSGDSITQGNQWSYHVYKTLCMKSHHNTAVGSSVWYKRTTELDGRTITTQDYGSEDFAGISDGWLETSDPEEIQKRMNNCAVVHIQKFLAEVKSGEYPAPDIFVFAYGTNDAADHVGDAEKALCGKEADGEPVDLFTEAGAMRWCIQKIQEAFPECRVFVMTPIQAADPAHNAKNAILADNMKKISGSMNAQVIDCFNNCGIIEKYEVIGGKGKYLRDGLHPEENGQRLEGLYVAKEIRNNYF